MFLFVSLNDFFSIDETLLYFGATYSFIDYILRHNSGYTTILEMINHQQYDRSKLVFVDNFIWFCFRAQR